MARSQRKWGFYGRADERAEIARILASGRFFFCSISGRRRIGKTTLIREALDELEDGRPTLYVQIPDSDELGVVQSFREAVEDNELSALASGKGRNSVRSMDEVVSFSTMARAISAL